VTAELILRTQAISKSFPGVQALDSVDFDCRRGEVHALIGENGAGKSTLMKILGGIYHPDAGELNYKDGRVETFSPHHAQGIGIALIHQELSLLPYLSVAENIFLGREPRRRFGLVDYRAMEAQAAQLLKQLGSAINPRLPVYRLPPAQRQLVEIAKALSLKPEVIIMDEPSSSLAEEELQRLFEIIRLLKAGGVTVIYISHRLEEILEIADRVTVLRDGRKIGVISIENATRENLIQMMVGREIEVLAAHAQKPAGEVIFEVNGLTRAGAFKDIHLALRRGEVVGMAGLIGSGRTELARALFGADRVDAGTVILNGQTLNLAGPYAVIDKGLALIPEERKTQGLVLTHTVRENAALPNLKLFQKFGVVNRTAERAMVGRWVDQLDIQAASQEQQVAYLSGGNQQKVVLAKWLNIGPEVIIFDEPTRGIDVGAKVEIHRLIRQQADAGKAVLVISSELPEILALSDRVVVMSGGKIAGELSAAQASEESILALAYHSLGTARDRAAVQKAAGKSNGRTPTEAALQSTAAAEVQAAPRVLPGWRRWLAGQDLADRIVFLILLALILLGALGTERFFSLPNLTNILRQMTIPMLLATGQTLVILVGGIDLSVSSIVTLANVFAAGMMMGLDQRILPVALFCLLVGLLIGALNAFVIVKLKVVPIIATLGVMVIGQGVALIYTREPIGVIPRSLYSLSSAQFGPLPASTLWLVLVIAAAMVLLYYTPFGRHLYAVGGDSEIARLSGIAVNRVRAACYLISGLLAAATGLYLTSRMGSGDPTVGPGLELDSIAAVLLGGTALGGGRGGLVSTIIGVLVLVLVGNVFNQLGLRFWHQQVAKGLIIILAVVIYRPKK
jgi:rhamnose transport system ATP-binding protein